MLVELGLGAGGDDEKRDQIEGLVEAAEADDDEGEARDRYGSDPRKTRSSSRATYDTSDDERRRDVCQPEWPSNTPKKTRSPWTLLCWSRSRMTQHESSSMGELDARLLVS